MECNFTGFFKNSLWAEFLSKNKIKGIKIFGRPFGLSFYLGFVMWRSVNLRKQYTQMTKSQETSLSVQVK